MSSESSLSSAMTEASAKEALENAIGKQIPLTARPTIPFYSRGISDSAPDASTRNDLETFESRGFVQDMIAERDHRKQIRDRQQQIVDATEDRLNHERAKLADQNAVIDTIDGLIAELDKME